MQSTILTNKAMKAYITALIISSAFVLLACSTISEPDQTNTKTIDAEYTLVSTQESGACETFFKPRIGWVGDVMPFYDESTNIFNIFYLQDWRENGAIHPYWKVETNNFASYSNNALAISNGSSEEQDEALGTGCIMKGNDGIYYAFYTGEKSTNYIEGMPRQAVMRASSLDLKTWTKDYDFNMIGASPDYNYSEFRDPHVFWDADACIYRMVVASDYMGYDYKALAHYTSSDLSNWNLQDKPLIKTTRTFMECPDVFKIGEYWYVVYSSIESPRTVQYVYKKGTLDDDNAWSDAVSLDGYNYYAAKTAADKNGNRYLCGWCMTFEGEYDSSGWGGNLIVHRIVQEDSNSPILTVKVPDAIADKFKNDITLSELKREGAVTNTDTQSYQLEYTDDQKADVYFSRLQSPAKISAKIHKLTDDAIFGWTFGAAGEADNTNSLRFLIEPSNSDKYDLAYDKDGLGSELVNWFSLWSIKDASEYKVEIYIEKSVVVIYVNDKIAMTNRMYNTQDNPWYIFCEKGKVEFIDLQITNY